MEKDNFGFEDGSPPPPGPAPAPPYSYPPVGPAASYALPAVQYSGPAHQGAPSTQYTVPQYTTTQAIVGMPAAQQTVVVQTGLSRPPSYLWLSCLVYWCCNCVFGGIAFALSMASSSAADENQMEEARNYGRASCWVSVFGAIIGVVVIVILIVMYVTVWNNVNSIYGNNPYLP